MLYFTKKGTVQSPEDISVVFVSALGQVWSLFKLSTKTRRQMRNVQEMGWDYVLILSHNVGLAPLGSHLLDKQIKSIRPNNLSV